MGNLVQVYVEEQTPWGYRLMADIVLTRVRKTYMALVGLYTDDWECLGDTALPMDISAETAARIGENWRGACYNRVQFESACKLLKRRSDDLKIVLWHMAHHNRTRAICVIH